MKKQKIYVVSSPSGCGKTTVVQMLCERTPSIKRAVTSTTRSPRSGEIQGKDYFFLEKPAFQDRVQQGGFIETTERYGHYYGLSCHSIQSIHDSQCDVIVNVDWQGLHSLRRIYGHHVISFFLLPPSLQVLKNRLITRNLDSIPVIKHRLDCARSDAQNWHYYDHVLVNDHLMETVQTMTGIIEGDKYITNKKEIQKHVSFFDQEDCG